MGDPFVGPEVDVKDGEEDEEEEDEETKEKARRDKEARPKKGEVVFLTNSEAIGSKLASLNHTPLKELQINGVTGELLALAPTLEADVVCLFSPVNPLFPDASGGVPIIHCIDALLGSKVSIDTSNLEKEVARIEKEVQSALKSVVVSAAADVPKHDEALQAMYM